MKNIKTTKMVVTLLCVIGGVAIAAQDSTLSQREVRDPVQLEVILEANAADAESRIASLEGGSTVGAVEPGYIIVGNASTVGVDVVVSGDITMATNGAVAIATGVIVNADVSGSAAITGGKLDLTSGTGAITSSGAISGTAISASGQLSLTGGGMFSITQLNVASTNGGVIAGTRSYYVLDASAQGNAVVTNTITAPASAGLVLYLVNDGASNTIEITEGTTLDAGGALTLGPEDGATLISRSAAAWSVVGFNDN